MGDLKMKVALDATEGDRASDVRSQVRRLAKDRRWPTQLVLRVDALLKRASNLSRMRNDLMHRAVKPDETGGLIQKDETQTWGPAPTADEIKKLADDIVQLVNEINEERLHGFINDACHRYLLADPLLTQ